MSAIVASTLAMASSAQMGHATSGAPALLSHATDLGRVSASGPIEVTVWLKLHDSAGLDDVVAAQQNGQPMWLSEEQVRARHIPAAADVNAVGAFLKAQGLTISSVGPENLFVKATGSLAAVEAAFRVELHEYNLHGKTFRAATGTPVLPSSVAPLIASVGGLSNLGAKPNVVHAKTSIGANPNVARPSDAEGLKTKPIALSEAANGLIFSAQCFYSPTSVSFSGSDVEATYQGNRYGASTSNTAPGTVGPCGYQPTDIYTAYNLTPLYKAGLDGTGETIAIVDAYGSKTVAADLEAFSDAMGLPKPKLTIIGKSTESTYSTDTNATWATETNLDVQWVHAIAPGAKIILVVAPTNSFDDLFTAIATASAQPGVVAISNSWSGYESQTDIPTRSSGDGLLKLAIARGQSVSFATGDEGNETYDLGYVDVNYPASSPYATGVGGVSVGLDRNKHISFQTAWGNNITEIADTKALGSPPVDPPLNEGFVYGGGGGTSNVYPLPSFQHSLGGQRRLVPDISWVADPYTGVEIVYTGDSKGDQYVETIGGTSLATPMFSALWGITTQRARHPLGEAAPYLYRLPKNALMDVLATPTSSENVTGVLFDDNGVQDLTTWELALPLQGQQNFYSALYNSPYSTRWFVLTFGTDSTLQAGPGWDEATGLGAPNGWNFVQAIGN